LKIGGAAKVVVLVGSIIPLSLISFHTDKDQRNAYRKGEVAVFAAMIGR
jgi:hypothetical protein